MKEILLPAMGEGITDATIVKIKKQVGEAIEADEVLFEIATDKVDSEITAPVSGFVQKILVSEGQVAPVGAILAVITASMTENAESTVVKTQQTNPVVSQQTVKHVENTEVSVASHDIKHKTPSGKFLSPLVRSMAKAENISIEEIESIVGTGVGNKITKEDIEAYLLKRNNQNTNPAPAAPVAPLKQTQETVVKESAKSNIPASGNFEIVEMDRMRKLIAGYMIESKRTSAHVTSFVEVDMTNVVMWRNKVKESFQKREGENITFMPIFVQAVVAALKDFPGVNVSVDDTRIIYKKDLNVGIAAALPSGNLIVPVVKNADRLSLTGLAKSINDLANRARANKLKPDEIQGGTFTITNMGTFGNITGTPIINQPEVAILAVGAIKKKPAVIESPQGDMIAIRHLMVMSMSYDHRVVDGAMGGMFLKRVADWLEAFDVNTKF